jgi:hypothetical protein
MKTLYQYITILILLPVILFSGCMKEPPVMGVPKMFPYISLAEIKSFYKGSDLPLTESNARGTSKITGIVISDAANKNIPAGMVIIQNDTTGIVLSMDAAAAAAYNTGDSLEIKFSSGILSNEKGRLQIKGLAAANIKKLATGKVIAPVQVTAKALTDNFDRYEARLVKIAGADVVPAPAPGETYSGDKDLYDGSIAAGTIKLHTEAAATVATEQALANGTFTGIALYYNAAANTSAGAVKQLWMRNKQDIEDNSIPFHSDIIITGFLSDPRGADGPYNGQASGALIHAGGYEYIQLLATRDIDFAVTPFSVVTCNNGTATASGWAAGGALTYKFNLTSGTAAKGTFFYVGGPSKVIAGYSGVKSTDISGANWIRTINYNANNAAVITGDGFGNSNGGILGNLSATSTNTADGIAVFSGTDVTPLSVPIDAVFYGVSVSTAYNNGNGYRIPANDHYNPVNKATGEAQPFFGQGTNTYLFTNPAADISSFPKLGGVLSPNAWLTPRQATLVNLPLTAQLSDIQTAVGVTFFRQ